MYAIIEEGGKQYKVTTGDIVEVVKLNKKQGEKVEITKVLLVADGEKVAVGQPLLEKATVAGEVIKEDKTKKVVIFKYKKKKSYARKLGHRQDFTRIKITDIKM